MYLLGRGRLPATSTRKQSAQTPSSLRSTHVTASSVTNIKSGAALEAPVSEGDELQLTCVRLALEGKGVCLLPPSNYVLLTARARPGEVLRARVTAVRKGYAEAVKLSTLAPPHHPEQPACPHCGPCGGCSLQGIAYDAQVAAKAEQVAQTLARVGRLSALEAVMRPPLPAPSPYGYRNKLQLSFSSYAWLPPPDAYDHPDGRAVAAAAVAAVAGGGSPGAQAQLQVVGRTEEGGVVVARPVLGLLRPGSARDVLPLGEGEGGRGGGDGRWGCALQGTQANAVVRHVAAEAPRLGLLPHNDPSGQGCLRHLIIRSARSPAARAAALAAAHSTTTSPGGLQQVGTCGLCAEGHEQAAGAAQHLHDTQQDQNQVRSGAEGGDVELLVVVVTGRGVRGGEASALRALASGLMAAVPGVVGVVHRVSPPLPPPPGRAANGAAAGSSGRGSSGEQHKGGRQQRGQRQGGPRSGRDASSSAAGSSSSSHGASGESASSQPGLVVSDEDGSGGAGQEVVLAGVGEVREVLGGVELRVSPAAFLQVNTAQAEALYRVVREGAGLRPSDAVVDLYCGTGSIGLALARHCAGVVGVEAAEAAVRDAVHNAAANGITNAAFVAADLSRGVPPLTLPPGAAAGQTPGSQVVPDVVVVDPARAGLSAAVTSWLATCGARTLVYVSCNPATQARDLAQLCGTCATVVSPTGVPVAGTGSKLSVATGVQGVASGVPAAGRQAGGKGAVKGQRGSNAGAGGLKDGGTVGPYMLVSVTPVDLFPQTDHCETVAVLHRRV